MLVFQRSQNTSVLITDGEKEMKIHVLAVYPHERWGGMVKIGFEVPDSVKVWREELYYAEKMQISLDDARVMLRQRRYADRQAAHDYALPGL